MRGALPPRLKRSAGFLLALTLSLLLACAWMLVVLWASSPYWVPPLAERLALENGVSLKLSGFARPSIAGVRIGRLQLVNETTAVSVDDLTIDWIHPEAPETAVMQTLFKRLLSQSSQDNPNTDLILLSIRAVGLDMHAGHSLPPMLGLSDELPEASESSGTPSVVAAVRETRGRRLVAILDAFESRQVKSQHPPPLIPDLNLPFGLQLDAELMLDQLRFRAEVGEAESMAQPPEQLAYVADALVVKASGLDRRPMSVALKSAGNLSLPSMWREQGSSDQGALSFSLDPLVPLQLEASIDQAAVRVGLSSKPLRAALALETETTDPTNAAAWRLRGQMMLNTAGQTVGFMLPPIPPVLVQALALQVDRATAAVDIDLRLDDELLPHSVQPEHARLAADLQFDASGPPGRLRLSQVLKLGREDGVLTMKTSPGRYEIDPDPEWWKRNAWFKATGFRQAALQSWRLEPRAIDCQLASWQVAGEEIPECQWPLALAVQAGQNKVTVELTPAFAARTTAAHKVPAGLAVKLVSTGEQLHELLPERWSVSGRATIQRPRATDSKAAWQLELKQAGLSLESLTLPDLQIDQLDLEIPELRLRIPQVSLADGSTTPQMQSTTGGGAAKLDMRFRSSLLPTSEALPVSADLAVDLIESAQSDLPDMQLDVKSLQTAGMTLVSKLRVETSDRAVSGPLRVSGKPDSTLLNAVLQGAAGEAVPGLDVKPGDLLFKGLVNLDVAGSAPKWSTEGLLGLQKWQITTEKAEAKRLTISASLAVDEQRLQVFDEGEALSTVSADLSVLGIPFPALFLKFTTDLIYGAGQPPGATGIAGTVTLSQARVGAFLGEVSLGSPLTLPLPLSQVSEAEPVHIPLRLRGVDLGALVALENEHIDATGTISGRLGLVYTGNSVQIPASAPGRLAADGGGRIRLKEAGQWQSMAGGNPQLLFAVGALGNFQYDSLKTSVIFDDDEWLKLGLELRGRNPEVMDARPIHYNLNVETNILSLLQSLEMTKNLSETLEQRLLKAYE